MTDESKHLPTTPEGLIEDEDDDGVIIVISDPSLEDAWIKGEPMDIQE